MDDTIPQKMKVDHTGIMRIIVFVSSTSVTVQSFHLLFCCSSIVVDDTIIAALSKHLHYKNEDTREFDMSQLDKTQNMVK